jgi:hypothetical protein
MGGQLILTERAPGATFRLRLPAAHKGDMPVDLEPTGAN